MNDPMGDSTNIGVQEWPEVWLLREPEQSLPYGGWRLRNPDPDLLKPYDEVQRYVPESGPNVLTPDEARICAEAVSRSTTVAETRFDPLIQRLSSWAQEASR